MSEKAWVILMMGSGWRIRNSMLQAGQPARGIREQDVDEDPWTMLNRLDFSFGQP